MKAYGRRSLYLTASRRPTSGGKPGAPRLAVPNPPDVARERRDRQAPFARAGAAARSRGRGRARELISDGAARPASHRRFRTNGGRGMPGVPLALVLAPLGSTRRNLGTTCINVPPLSCFESVRRFKLTAAGSDLSSITYDAESGTLFAVNNGERAPPRSPSPVHPRTASHPTDSQPNQRSLRSRRPALTA